MHSIDYYRNRLDKLIENTRKFVDGIYSRELSKVHVTNVKFKWRNNRATIEMRDLKIIIRTETVAEIYQNDIQISRFVKHTALDGNSFWGIYWRSDNPTVTNITNATINRFNKEHSVKAARVINYMHTDCIEISTIPVDGQQCITEKIQLTPVECAARVVLMNYHYDDRHLTNVYTKYEKYPIMKYRQSVHTFLMIRWFRNSIFDILPKDVVRLIAKEIWAFRLLDDESSIAKEIDDAKETADTNDIDDTIHIPE